MSQCFSIQYRKLVTVGFEHTTSCLLPHSQTTELSGRTMRRAYRIKEPRPLVIAK